MAFVRTVFGFLLAWVVGTAAMTMIHTQFVIERVVALGVSVSMSQRLDWTLADLIGMNDFTAPSELLPVIMWIAFLVAFLVASILTRLIGGLRVWVFMTAGFCSVVAVLFVFKAVFGIMPIAGARGLAAMLTHGLAGIVAGFLFSTLTPSVKRG